MYPREILKKFTLYDLYEIAKLLHVYFPLVDVERIFELILQVDSIDTTLHLLCVHRESNLTLDAIVYDFLNGRDNLHA